MRWVGALLIALGANAHAQGGGLPMVREQTVRAQTAWAAPGAVAKGARAGERGSGAGFPGLGSTGQSPANCAVAGGPGAVVQAVNGQVAFFTREGVQTFGSSALAFFSGLAQTPSPYQPHRRVTP